MQSSPFLQIVICWVDVDADCDIDFADYTDLLSNWGDCGESAGSSGLTAEYIETWMSAGGQQAILTDSITMAEIAAAMDQPTAAQQLAALYALLD